MEKIIIPDLPSKDIAELSNEEISCFVSAWSSFKELTASSYDRIYFDMAKELTYRKILQERYVCVLGPDTGDFSIRTGVGFYGHEFQTQKAAEESGRKIISTNCRRGSGWIRGFVFKINEDGAIPVIELLPTEHDLEKLKTHEELVKKQREEYDDEKNEKKRLFEENQRLRKQLNDLTSKIDEIRFDRYGDNTK